MKCHCHHSAPGDTRCSLALPAQLNQGTQTGTPLWAAGMGSSGTTLIPFPAAPPLPTLARATTNAGKGNPPGEQAIKAEYNIQKKAISGAAVLGTAPVPLPSEVCASCPARVSLFGEGLSAQEPRLPLAKLSFYTCQQRQISSA